jgi:hypothetical protein
MNWMRSCYYFTSIPVGEDFGKCFKIRSKRSPGPNGLYLYLKVNILNTLDIE